MVLFVSKLDSLSAIGGFTLLEALKAECDKYVLVDLDADQMILAFSDEKEARVRALLSGFPLLHVSDVDPLSN